MRHPITLDSKSPPGGQRWGCALGAQMTLFCHSKHAARTDAACFFLTPAPGPGPVGRDLQR